MFAGSLELWLIGRDCAAATGAAMRKEGNKVVDFSRGGWLEVRRTTIGFGVGWHAEICSARNDDAAQGLVTDQSQEGGIVDRAGIIAAVAARSVAIGARTRIN